MVAAMELKLDDKEAGLLKTILEQHLSDLRMEIADTEKYDWRNEMKKDEETIKSLIARLGAPGSS
jgi:hypothetical protein